ncbi:hypothetical protein VIGAN_09109700 [Vigna angularis var. angularis]|uniref:Uncharacterized protein n=1 Tax=Vigna angularis var. angularis TaxID=157739 RepID=A0A0S3SXQ7_PHAAN|nr:hypothetical protein VIGAN_09109700 [Vigna angularis var. angularis]
MTEITLVELSVHIVNFLFELHTASTRHKTLENIRLLRVHLLCLPRRAFDEETVLREDSRTPGPCPATLLDSPASKIKHNHIPLPCSISINKAVVSGTVPSYALDSCLRDCGQATAICRVTVQRLLGRSLEGLPV